MLTSMERLPLVMHNEHFGSLLIFFLDMVLTISFFVVSKLKDGGFFYAQSEESSKENSDKEEGPLRWQNESRQEVQAVH